MLGNGLRKARQASGQGTVDQAKRDLKIKTNAVQRLSKELELYEQEKGTQAAKVEEMRAKNADAHDIKRGEDLLAEAAMMVPDTKQRLANALESLAYIEDEKEHSLASTEEWQAAASTVGHARQLLAV